MQLNIKFELKPKQRPRLAEEIAAALHTIPCYQRLPSCSYKIGDCTLEKDGMLFVSLLALHFSFFEQIKRRYRIN